jgi:PKD repeat protein
MKFLAILFFNFAFCMARLLLAIVSANLTIFNSAFSQKQGNVWYFGDHAGLDFSSGSPVVLNNGQTPLNAAHAEGSSVICDSSGALLFYSNGQKAWNKNHQLMPNGDSLYSNSSATQAALIVPLPGSSRYFYVFTVDDFYFDNLQYGFRYSIVDMCLDNGNGDIPNNEKNILVLDTVTEKLAGIRHANGTDYWIVVHKYYSNEFYAYHFSSAGLSSPVISATGSVHPKGTSNQAAAIGQMKASPDGGKLAIVNGNSNDNIVEYFDFDNTTGIVSNWVDLQWLPVYNFYGCSFSPDNSKLYVSSMLNGNGIYQFDLSAGSPASVIASRKKIADTHNFFSLQLAVDGKIYCSRSPIGYNPYLDVINNPNDTGVTCGYVSAQLDLNGHHSSYGLVNFIDSYDYSNTIHVCPVQTAFVVSVNDLCPGTCTDFTNLSVNGTSYQWYFQGGTPASSTDADPQNICYSAPGSYDVQLIATNANGSDTLLLTNYITVYPAPAPQAITQSGDTLFANAGGTSYQWYFNGNLVSGATNYFYVAQSSGDYNVVATDNNGCEVEAAIFSVIANIKSPVGNGLPMAIGMAIFPNPVSGKFTMHNPEFTMGAAIEISIYNMVGERILFQEAILKSNESIIDVSRFETGMYFIELTSGAHTFRTKFIKAAGR